MFLEANPRNISASKISRYTVVTQNLCLISTGQKQRQTVGEAMGTNTELDYQEHTKSHQHPSSSPPPDTVPRLYFPTYKPVEEESCYPYPSRLLWNRVQLSHRYEIIMVNGETKWSGTVIQPNHDNFSTVKYIIHKSISNTVLTYVHRKCFTT